LSQSGDRLLRQAEVLPLAHDAFAPELPGVLKDDFAFHVLVEPDAKNRPLAYRTEMPVTLPPGGDGLATKPVPTESPAAAITIGMSLVTCFIACASHQPQDG
jgi:hypothetical protein